MTPDVTLFTHLKFDENVWKTFSNGIHDTNSGGKGVQNKATQLTIGERYSHMVAIW